MSDKTTPAHRKANASQELKDQVYEAAQAFMVDMQALPLIECAHRFSRRLKVISCVSRAVGGLGI